MYTLYNVHCQSEKQARKQAVPKPPLYCCGHKLAVEGLAVNGTKASPTPVNDGGRGVGLVQLHINTLFGKIYLTLNLTKCGWQKVGC